MRINTLYVIMKLVERCNLNCSYCYYYTPDNAAVFERPTLMRPAVLERLIGYMDEACSSHDIGRVVFAFHGGEPTLAKPAVVKQFCTDARRALQDRVKVGFAIQTNGVAVSDAWIRLMREERMDVGVSIDGSRAVHDAYRVDHFGRGSYDRIAATVTRLRVAASAGDIHLSVLAVMGETFEGMAFYEHMVDVLGIRNIKLLFPDCTHDTLPADVDQAALGRSLCGMFDRWLASDQDTVRVALFEEAVRAAMLARSPRPRPLRLDLGCAVLSDGSVRISDDFMAPAAWFAGQRDLNIFDSRFGDWFAQPHLDEVLAARAGPAADCAGCELAATCAGGDLPNRHSAANGFDNRSAYCTALGIFHGHVASRLSLGFDTVAAEARRA